MPTTVILFVVAALLGAGVLASCAAKTRGSRSYKDHEFLGHIGDWPPGSEPFYVVAGDPALYELELSFLLASRWWNNQLGRVVFATTVTRAGAIIPLVANDLKGHAAMEVVPRMYKDGEIFSMAIHVDTERVDGMRLDYIQRLCRHELGHVLRLRHDEDPSALMYPVLEPDAAGDLSEADKKRLRDWYDLRRGRMVEE